MANHDIWAWYGAGLIPQIGANDLRNGLNSTTYTAGTHFDFQPYGTMQMVDGNDDGVIRDADMGDGSTAGSDRIVIPDSQSKELNEVALYQNTVIHYLDFDNNPQTWTVTLTVWQLEDGDAVFRLPVAHNPGWPAGFFPGNVTSIQIGTWDGQEYSAATVSNHLGAPPVTCFASGTVILTARGAVTVEELRVGDHVLTRDSGYKSVRWIGSRRLSRGELLVLPRLRPVRIAAGALGHGLPTADLIVSPHHRILIVSEIASRMFGEREVLVPAKDLVGNPGIRVLEGSADVTYWHFLLDGHHLVNSNGAVTESLYTGAQALRALPPQSRQEIFEIFPELRALDHAGLPAPARLFISGRRARRLIARAGRNGQLLVA